MSWICTRLLGCWALVVRPNYSEELGTKIDQAIRGISDECYLNSLTILMNHRACLDALADELVEVQAPRIRRHSSFVDAHGMFQRPGVPWPHGPTKVETLSGDRLREIVASYTQIPEKLAAV